MYETQSGICSICGRKMDNNHNDKQCYKVFRRNVLDQMPEGTSKERFVKGIARLGFYKLLSIVLIAFILLPQFVLFIAYSFFRGAFTLEMWRTIEILLIAINLWTWSLAIFIGWWGERSSVAVTYRRLLENERKTTIDEIFLLHRDGRLIKHYTRRLKPDFDEDILGAMLVAVQDFVKDSFRNESGPLHEIKFGELGIKICRGKHILVTAVISGADHEQVFRKILSSIGDIESKHADTLQDWDGDLDKVRELDSYMRKIIAGTA